MSYCVRSVSGLIAVTAIIVSLGCETAKSANPTSPSVAGPIPGVAITAPRLLEPYPGSEIVAAGQRLSLLIENAGSSGQRELWMTIEMAQDANFQKVLHQADRVGLGPQGRTSYVLPEPLAPGFTYYWRVRAQDGANTGPYSAVSSFTMVQQVIIEAPTPLEPAGNLSTNRPQFKVNNPKFSGTSVVIVRFEVFATQDMSQVVAIVTSPLGSGGTTSMSLGDLPWSKTYFWRAYATDYVTTSPPSPLVQFKTAPEPAPPPPTPGPAAGVPLGPGGRTPNPGPGQRLPLPDMSRVVQQVASANPGALKNSCQDSGGSWQFMDMVVDTLRTYDTRWGYNGKRGNTGDPSKDVIDYNWGGHADEGTTDVYLIDIINGHCGSSPSATWNNVTDITINSGTIGRWTGRGRLK